MKKKKGFIAAPATVISTIAILLAALMSVGSPESILDPENWTEIVGEVLPGSQQELAETASAAAVMEVHFIDAGQSDSTLIINGEHTMLIDAGDNDKGTLIQMYLQEQGITQLDYLVLTHNDADHIGGADVVITKFDVDTVFMSDNEKKNATYRDVIQALKYKTLTWETPKAGSVYSLGDASFTIFAPVEEYSDHNNSSIGLLLEKGDTRFLFTGDAEKEAEADIIEYCMETGLDIRTDVYQAGHHGSSTSSSEAFLDMIMPSAAVISCGEDNSYGFPHVETMKSFKERGIQVLRTDEQGSIVAVSDGKDISWLYEEGDS